MNNAIIFIKNDKELELAKANLSGKALINYAVNEIKRLDVDNIYLVGGKDLIVDGTIKRDDVNEIIEDLSNKEGKCLLTSPFYPLALKEDYAKVLSSDDEDGALLVDKDGLCAIFMLPNNQLKNFENVNFKEFEIDSLNSKKINSLNELSLFAEEIRIRTIKKLINNGVNIISPINTYIGPDVIIDKNTIVYPNVVIEGKCLIGKNNTITSGSHLVNVIMSDGNNVINSRIVDSNIHCDTVIGPNANIRNNSEINDRVVIGNYVEIKNSKIGEDTRIKHLAYIGDATVGKDVNIGCGAITINYDGTRKYATVIKDHAFIGANANLIAPITIGESAMVAAASTVESDVMDGDMAISRLYQTNKKGYGYRYINKES